MTDESGNGIRAEKSGWSFEGIAPAFEEHIDRSVPHYRDGHDLICRYSDFILRDDSLVYEIGSASGTLAGQFMRWHKGRENLRYVGLDIAESMVEYAAAHAEPGDARLMFMHEDICTFSPQPASVFIAYYTLQFIHPAYRQSVVTKLYESLEWGGALFLFEKVRAPDARFQDYANQAYIDYKLEQGFSPDEVLNKSGSLKGVLEPFSTQGNLDLMQRAGFVDVMTLYKWVNFEGWLAIK